MLSVSIDASVLAAPSLCAPKEEIYSYVDTLLDWGRLLEEDWISVCLTERCSEVLVEEGLFPLRPALAEVFAINGIMEFDANTVAKAAERLLSLTPSFESMFRLRDVLYDSLETDPAIASLTMGQSMEAELGRCVVIIAMLRRCCFRSVYNHSLVLRRSPQSGQILVRTVIHDVDHDREDLTNIPVHPDQLEGSVPTCGDFRGCIVSTDEALLWRSSDDETGKRLAIRCALVRSRLERGEDPEWDSTPTFRFGKEFLEREARICRDNSDELVRRLLRSIVETLEGSNLPDVHALRRGRGGNDPQRVRTKDKAKAWRRDIDHEYHLHFWECPDGIPEFGSVGPHNDFSLPE